MEEDKKIKKHAKEIRESLLRFATENKKEVINDAFLMELLKELINSYQKFSDYISIKKHVDDFIDNINN